MKVDSFMPVLMREDWIPALRYAAAGMTFFLWMLRVAVGGMMRMENADDTL